MIKRKSPITVSEVRFCSIDPDEADCTMFAEQFIYDKRHDFLVDSNFCGIAAKIMLDRKPAEKGIRRSISLCLVDNSMRCEVATRQIKVSMGKDIYFKDICACFTSDSIELKAGHTYKLVIKDESSSETLAVETIHLFGREHGNPEDWYTVVDGGVTPTWECHTLYKSLKTINDHDYYVRFDINQNFGVKLPEILPEMEVRLHYPDGGRVDVRFMEPLCFDFDDNRYFVQCPLMTTDDETGVFYAELLCMQYVLAGFAFGTNLEDEKGIWFGNEIEPLDEYSPDAAKERLRKLLPGAHIPDSWEGDLDEALDKFIQSQNEEFGSTEDVSEDEEDDKPETEDSAKFEVTDTTTEESIPGLSFDYLTGLTAVKEKLTVYERLVRFNRMRQNKGLATPDVPLHTMFLGSPGTGKTTVAKLMGQMLKKAGVLSKGHVIVRERSTLLGMYYSSEGENTLKALEEAQGGILFIDEAYQLYQRNDPKDPGKFVIETLLTALADDSNRDWMLILAGYPDEMKQMFEMNPGFKSRIPESNIYRFDDFTSSELMEIAENYLTRYDYKLSQDAREALMDRLDIDCSQRDKNFGNARHVMNLIQTEILPAMAVRVTNSEYTEDNQLSEIQVSDIPIHNPAKALRNRAEIGYRA